VSRPGGAAGGVRLTGRVLEFDPAVGLGRVSQTASGATYPFHCTQILGGSRTIEVGTEVAFTVVAGRIGRWEAAGVGPA
jgi:cold shock CspA family protein